MVRCGNIMGTDWTQIGGDDLNGSWADGTYEKKLKHL